MAKAEEKIKAKPAVSPEQQENICIALANELAEQRLREGKATSQEILHFLRLGSPKEKLEREKAEEELKLIKAKTEAYQSGKNIEEMYAKAIEKMKIYRGETDD